jgi:hypothetical protein
MEILTDKMDILTGKMDILTDRTMQAMGRVTTSASTIDDLEGRHPA